MNPDEDKFILYLQKSRAIKVLLLLSEPKARGLDELLEKIGGSKATGMKRIKELKEIGLIKKTIYEIKLLIMI